MKQSGNVKISKLRYIMAVAVVLVTAFAVAASIDAINSQLLKELASFTDSFDSVMISDEQVPLADQNIETTSKTTTKTVKLSKKAKKTYTKKLPDKTADKTTVSRDEDTLVVKDIATKTAATEKYTKNKKTKKVSTTVTTTAITTTYPVEGAANENVSDGTKTTTKTVKLSKKAKKTYTKKLPDKATAKTTVSNSGNTLIQKDTITETKTTEKYTKNKKTKKVVYAVTTTVITSKYTMKYTEPENTTEAAPPAGQPEAQEPSEELEQEPSGQPEAQEPAEEPEQEPAEQPEAQEPAEEPEQEPAEQPETSVGDDADDETADSAADAPSNDTAPALPEGTSAIRTAAPEADSALLGAFEQLGFTFTIDASYQYTGVFDARTRNITLRYNDDNVYHELGHFLAFVAGNYDVSSSFKTVYSQEKSLYKGRNQAYILKNSSEYFAESYRDYVLNKSALQDERPLTYEAIEKALGKVNDAQIIKIKNYYAGIWG